MLTTTDVDTNPANNDFMFEIVAGTSGRDAVDRAEYPQGLTGTASMTDAENQIATAVQTNGGVISHHEIAPAILPSVRPSSATPEKSGTGNTPVILLLICGVIRHWRGKRRSRLRSERTTCTAE
jgi:hypothetical protein